ncbi:MAG: cyclase family protein [Bdellovibrionales bacterium]
MGEYFDITPVISERMAVFPGDQPFRRQLAMSFGQGNHLELSSVQTTVHLGAHADAPSHYTADGVGIHERDLSLYMGACQVVRVVLKRGARIRPSDVVGLKVQAERVLFYTGSYPNPDQWNEDFNSLSPELIEMLYKQGVRLVGIDTPSIDPAAAKDLLSHHAVARHDMAILEGVVLEKVPEGLYTLIALPLRLAGLDASPVRAILLKRTAALGL